MLVVDDHKTVADLLSMAMTPSAGLRCVGVAYDAPTALRLAEQHLPDVVLCDLHLGEGTLSGLRVCREITERSPRSALLLLTGDPGALRMEDLLACGACGLLAKDGDLPQLLAAVRRASRDQLDVAPALLGTLARPATPLVSLSPREHEVLVRMGRGHDVARISRDLGIRPGTCRGYVKSVLHKLDAHTQLGAVVRAQELGLLGRAP